MRKVSSLSKNEEGELKKRGKTGGQLYWVFECVPECADVSEEEAEKISDEKKWVPMTAIDEAKKEFVSLFKEGKYESDWERAKANQEWFVRWFGDERGEFKV